MKIKRAEIKNFRSLKDITIDFEPTCRILVGINESGKSNVLRALSMIDANAMPTKTDIREPLPNEQPISESTILFVLEMNSKELKSIYNNCKVKILSKQGDEVLLKKGRKYYNLSEIISLRNEGLYEIDVEKQTKNAKYWSLDDDYIISGNWKKPNASCPPELEVVVGKDKKALLKNFVLINHDDFSDIPEEQLDEVTLEDIDNLVSEEITDTVDSNLPDVIFWEYDEKNLLPPSVVLADFAVNPDSCIPLKNMFSLAGVADIQQELNEAQTKSQNALRNLLSRVAVHTTNHFRKVWKEYKDVKFNLEPNGANIDASIHEKNRWDFAQRSDGFKRFVSFLLLISIKVQTNTIGNTLLLIDEPDVSLHPSGARYLRDELIKIAKTNTVIFTTHSIFMIDRDYIGRHIIVKKQKEQTSITKADESNFVDEEVIYNALGYSIFETLNENNIIFEGWRDKRLFQVAISNLPTNMKEFKKKLQGIGLCHAKGVKQIKCISPMLGLARRKCIIISDCDKPALECQKKYIESHSYGEWFTYKDVDEDCSSITGEDFIKDTIIKKALNKIRKQYSEISGEPTLNLAGGKLNGVSIWLNDSSLESEKCKSFLNELKGEIFSDLKTSHIENSYYDFLKKLAEKIEC